jgi:hypothetical protein
MAKKWLIDAHNVIHKEQSLKSRLAVNPADVFRQFIALVNRKCRQKGMQARIVFDGQPILDSTFNSPEVYFSRERTADEVIISHLKKDGASQKWVVVTDDREIRQHAYYYNVDIIRTDHFLSEPSATQEKEKTGKDITPLKDPGKDANPVMDESELEEMMKLFKSAKKK